MKSCIRSNLRSSFTVFVIEQKWNISDIIVSIAELLTILFHHFVHESQATLGKVSHPNELHSSSFSLYSRGQSALLESRTIDERLSVSCIYYILVIFLSQSGATNTILFSSGAKSAILSSGSKDVINIFIFI